MLSRRRFDGVSVDFLHVLLSPIEIIFEIGALDSARVRLSVEAHVRELLLQEVAERGVAHDFAPGRDVLLEFLVDAGPRLVHHEAVLGDVARVLVQRRLEEVLRADVHVERERVVRLLADVAVHARHHPVRHHVAADPLQLVVRHVLEVQERVEADALPVVDVRRALPDALLVAAGLLRVGQAGHADAHQVHVVLLLRQLGDVQPMPVHALGAQVDEARALALAALREPLQHLPGRAGHRGGARPVVIVHVDVLLFVPVIRVFDYDAPLFPLRLFPFALWTAADPALAVARGIAHEVD